MTLKKFYLLAAVVGAIVPYIFFLGFANDEGLNLLAFVEGLFVNGAAGGFTADLVISSAIFWVYMGSRAAAGPKPALFIVLNLTIGLSCALPAYLWAAEGAKA